MSQRRAELIGRNWNILDKLYEKRRFVHELAEELDKTDAAVSASLKDLREGRLVDFEKGEGRLRIRVSSGRPTKSI